MFSNLLSFLINHSPPSVSTNEETQTHHIPNTKQIEQCALMPWLTGCGVCPLTFNQKNLFSPWSPWSFLAKKHLFGLGSHEATHQQAHFWCSYECGARGLVLRFSLISERQKTQHSTYRHITVYTFFQQHQSDCTQMICTSWISPTFKPLPVWTIIFVSS